MQIEWTLSQWPLAFGCLSGAILRIGPFFARLKFNISTQRLTTQLLFMLTIQRILTGHGLDFEKRELFKTCAERMMSEKMIMFKDVRITECKWSTSSKFLDLHLYRQLSARHFSQNDQFQLSKTISRQGLNFDGYVKVILLNIEALRLKPPLYLP